MRNRNLPRSVERLGSIASVARFLRPIGIRLSSATGCRVFRFSQHRAGLFVIGRPRQHRHQRMQCALEFVVVLVAQRRVSGPVEHPVEFLQIYINAASGSLHLYLPSSWRNCFVNGYPRTSLMDRFGT